MAKLDEFRNNNTSRLKQFEFFFDENRGFLLVSPSNHEPSCLDR